MPAKTWAAKSAAVVSELFTAGSNASLKTVVKAVVKVSKKDISWFWIELVWLKQIDFKINSFIKNINSNYTIYTYIMGNLNDFNIFKSLPFVIFTHILPTQFSAFVSTIFDLTDCFIEFD